MHELIDNCGALVLKIMRDFFLLGLGFFFFLTDNYLPKKKVVAHKKEGKKKGQWELKGNLTKIRIPINLRCHGTSAPHKNIHRAEWILDIGIPFKNHVFTLSLSLSLSLSLWIKKSQPIRKVETAEW